MRSSVAWQAIHWLTSFCHLLEPAVRRLEGTQLGRPIDAVAGKSALSEFGNIRLLNLRSHRCSIEWVATGNDFIECSEKAPNMASECSATVITLRYRAILGGGLTVVLISKTSRPKYQKDS